MNTINHSLLALALFGGIIPVRAMEKPNPNDNNNNNVHIPKFYFGNANRDLGLGALSVLPNEKIFEIMLFCINWDKTTLEEPFRTIQNLCETSTYLYTLAHSMLFDSKLVAELRERLKLCVEMDKYAEKNRSEGLNYQDYNALHIATEKTDVTFIKKILPKLVKHKMFNVINKKALVDGLGYCPIDLLCTAGPSAQDLIDALDNQKCEIIQVYMDCKIKPTAGALVVAARIGIYPKTCELLRSLISCEQMMEFFKEIAPALTNLSVEEKAHFINILVQCHACSTCKFE